MIMINSEGIARSNRSYICRAVDFYGFLENYKVLKYIFPPVITVNDPYRFHSDACREMRKYRELRSVYSLMSYSQYYFSSYFYLEKWLFETISLFLYN